MTSFHDAGLGRRTPNDFTHVERYPLSAIAEPVANFKVNRVLRLPYWHRKHDQGREGACVGFGKAMSLAIINLKQRQLAGVKPYTRRYNPWWVWDRSKERDQWAETNPGDSNGTSVNAACSVTHQFGAPLWEKTDPLVEEGIAAYRWATTVDEMRQSIAFGLPVTIGVSWYTNFDTPAQDPGDGSWWIGQGELTTTRGGHCVCVYGASDKRQAFRVKNSWGERYPLVWLPYDKMATLLSDYGEAAIVTDR